MQENQLLESNVQGIVAVDLSLRKNSQTELQQVFDSLPMAVESMPYVSAVILFIEQTSKNSEFIDIQTIFYGYTNPSATNKLPNDIEKALRTGYKVPFKSDKPFNSLLDD